MNLEGMAVIWQRLRIRCGGNGFDINGFEIWGATPYDWVSPVVRIHVSGVY